jgi:MYXO-CTERM domain-containing protein
MGIRSLTGIMRRVPAAPLAAAGIMLVMPMAAKAVTPAILYSQNFEPSVPTSSTSAVFGGFGQVNDISGTAWQVQGGGGGGGISVVTGVDTNGVGGSQALFANWDHSAATDFTFNQYTLYGLPGPGAGVGLSDMQISMDIRIDGSETSNQPLTINFQGNGGGPEWVYTPTLANGAYTHVQYTLNQATPPLLVTFDPTQSYNLRLQHGAGGFGFDANNIVHVDNIVVQVVPEPTTAAMGLLGLASLGAVRRRRN